jgi:(R)-citramalate synthase
MLKKIQIMDTTLRDGEQTAGVSFTADEKLTIAKALLIQGNVDSIEVGSALVSDGEFLGIKRICDWARAERMIDRIEVLGFVDHNRSVDWIFDSGCKVLNLLSKASLNHLTKQLKKTPEQHVKDINSTIEYAKSKGFTVNLYLEDCSNGLINSRDYVFFLLDNIKGIERAIICDTLGIWNPEQTHDYCMELMAKYKINFDFHGHSDYQLAVANALSAVNAGVIRIHTTVNGLGERSGNCSLATTVATIHDHTDKKTNVIEKNMSNLTRLVESISGIRVPLNKPIVGANVFTQCCGVHADGDKKGGLYCNQIMPERFGGERIYALGKTSGKASIEKNLESLGIKLNEDAVKKVLKRVVELGDKKENITLSDLPYIVSDVLGESVQEKVRLLDFSLKLESKNKPVAYVKLEIDGKDFEQSATGDGQYDAFMRCIKLVYDGLCRPLPKLIDYNVRIPPGGKTDALVETTITWQNSSKFTTRGVDSDQTTAAIKATLNMLNKVNSA